MQWGIKNKYLRQSVTDMDEKSAKKYKKLLSSALRDGDKERFAALSAEILKADAKSQKAEEALRYLSNHFDAIHIRYACPEALNGGATEPHISHILSSRLSSRPMAWSEQTLKHLVPVLVAGQFVLKRAPPSMPLPLKNRQSPKNEKPFLFLSACPTLLRPSLFLPAPARLLPFSMPSVPSDTKLLQ